MSIEVKVFSGGVQISERAEQRYIFNNQNDADAFIQKRAPVIFPGTLTFESKDISSEIAAKEIEERATQQARKDLLLKIKSDINAATTPIQIKSILQDMVKALKW
jgi:hypothetical protein